MQTKWLIKLSPGDANEFVSIASKCEFEIDVTNNFRSSYAVDAKSLVGVMGLDFGEPLVVTYRGFNGELEAYLSVKSVAV